MSAQLVILAGTGTDVGKTHVAEALVQAPVPTRRRIVWKPYESGVSPSHPSDSERLGTAVERAGAHTGWTLHPPLKRWSAPLAPPVAARLEGAPLDHRTLLDQLARLRTEAELVLVELAGGLFAPLTDRWLGVDLVQHLAPATLVVVAANRLGVLHDVIATTRAARAHEIDVDHLVLCEQAHPDPSAAHNPAMVEEWLPNAITVHRVAHAPAADLARSPALQRLANHLFGGTPPPRD